MNFLTQRICGIYTITSPTGKVYVGQSINILKRFKDYKSAAHTKLQRLVHRSIQKHGHSAHNFQILHICNRVELNEWEVYYIDLFQTFNTKHGLNLKSGGNQMCEYSAETLQKMREKGKARMTPERIEALRKYSIGNTFSLGSKRPMVAKISKGNKHAASLVLNTETGIFYDSVKDVSEMLGVKPKTMSARLNGQNRNSTSFIIV